MRQKSPPITIRYVGTQQSEEQAAALDAALQAFLIAHIRAVVQKRAIASDVNGEGDPLRTPSPQ